MFWKEALGLGRAARGCPLGFLSDGGGMQDRGRLGPREEPHTWTPEPKVPLSTRNDATRTHAPPCPRMAWALSKEVMSSPSSSIIQRRLDCVPFGLQGLEVRGRVGVRRRTWHGVGVGEHRSAFWFTSLVEAPGGVSGAPCLSFPMAAGPIRSRLPPGLCE